MEKMKVWDSLCKEIKKKAPADSEFSYHGSDYQLFSSVKSFD